MKLLRYILLLMILLAETEVLTAQSGTLKFDNVQFDFGTIEESDGEITHDFVLRNGGTSPFVVTDVRAHCGCTTFDYSRRPLMPDSTTTIRVVFNPQNQVGTIARKIYIRTSVADTVLMLRGTVRPRHRTAAERCNLAVGSSLFLDSNAHDFGTIEHGTLPRSSFSVYNGSNSAVTLHLVPAIESGYLDIRYPHELQPHEEGVIDFGYNIYEDTYGTINDILAIDVNGQRSEIQLIIGGIAIDARPKTDIKGAAKMNLSENFIKFGTLKRNSATRYAKIEICNIGTKPLHIRRIETAADVVQLRFEGSTTIAAGESRWLVVSIVPQKQRFGVVTDKIKIISDDMSKPVRTLRVSAIIEN